MTYSKLFKEARIKIMQSTENIGSEEALNRAAESLADLALERDDSIDRVFNEWQMS